MRFALSCDHCLMRWLPAPFRSPQAGARVPASRCAGKPSPGRDAALQIRMQRRDVSNSQETCLVNMARARLPPGANNRSARNLSRGQRCANRATRCHPMPGRKPVKRNHLPENGSQQAL